MKIDFLVTNLVLALAVRASINPITVQGRYFIDSVTKEPFIIKGLDYQPGGASSVSVEKDPLSELSECARDIALFQDLGINTIRVYSVHPGLDHDICMSMLAAAGIYLVLDVNSPLPGHHLNRYEPWLTYNFDYLKNVFRVVEQFSQYNNTLGFFAGNEVINDKISATNSPVYVKAVVKDIKMYIEQHAPRPIPVGYSAADDIEFRMPLSQFLQCSSESHLDAIDFYGVNSYQWCGAQTFQSSGYDTLVSDYSEFTKPLFLSEYGCNEVLPRGFNEVQAIYSPSMLGVFSGGLVYEYTQEPNNYGLVQLDTSGDVELLPDYFALQNQFAALQAVDLGSIVRSMLRSNARETKLRKGRSGAMQMECQDTYNSLDISRGPPPSVYADSAKALVTPGKYVHLAPEMLKSHHVVHVNGELYKPEMQVVQVADIMSGIQPHANGTYDNDDDVGYFSYYDDSDEPAYAGILEKIQLLAQGISSWCKTIIDH